MPQSKCAWLNYIAMDYLLVHNILSGFLSERATENKYLPSCLQGTSSFRLTADLRVIFPPT